MSQDQHRSQALTALSKFLVADASLGDTLQQVAEITVAAIPAADVAGMSLLDGSGQPTTAIYTDTESPQIDAAQYRYDVGPCLDAWRTGRVVRIDDMGSEGGRYPEFAEVARAHGVLSTLSLPLVAGGNALGALNLYAHAKHSFGPDDEAAGLELASAAAVVLANSSAYWQVYALSEGLGEAMKSRAIIEQAKGMLMARSAALTAADAFGVLQRASQRENVKLREIALRIVERRFHADLESAE